MCIAALRVTQLNNDLIQGFYCNFASVAVCVTFASSLILLVPEL